jgi:hypothetical protein
MSQSVTEEVVLHRLNAKLQERDQILQKCQHLSQACEALGDYYLVDFNQHLVIATHVQLEALAREEGCLGDWEEIVT